MLSTCCREFEVEVQETLFSDFVFGLCLALFFPRGDSGSTEIGDLRCRREYLVGKRRQTVWLACRFV